jgi:outer membrane protein OmpA-like peptidoglycan-associated protein
MARSPLPGVLVRVAGYADAAGDETYNLDLSRRRARSVAAVLAVSGMEIRWFGERLARGGRFAADRRVLVTVG